LEGSYEFERRKEFDSGAVGRGILLQYERRSLHDDAVVIFGVVGPRSVQDEVVYASDCLAI
jgi:hypothetical protein